MSDSTESASVNDDGFIVSFAKELFTSPVNLVLLGICSVLVYKIFFTRKRDDSGPPPEPQLPRMKRRDFTLEQMREYDGKRADGRLLMAVNGKVFDVTRGKRFYGQGGPYGVFAGRDASRGLATFSLSEDAIKDEYDDLSDLNSMQMDGIREWEMQFTEKYDYVGRLLKPGEQPQDYSDTEEEHSMSDKKD